MIAFFIKSAICLIIFYSFYHYFLREQKILLFNRLYLNLSLILSVLIPLIDIPVKSIYTLNDSIEKFNFTIDNVSDTKIAAYASSGQITLQRIIVTFFIIVSLILLTRFVSNMIKIVLTIIKSHKIKNNRTTVVLINKRILPYSFFKYVFVNKADFEEGKIGKELLLHEEAHCEQYHSIDIIIVELLKIVLWFNPAIWLIRKEIMLNHEYYADSVALNVEDSSDYQQLLLNVLLQNNLNYLVSNFKFSSIKKRIIMITKNNPPNNAIFRKTASILIFLLIGFTLTFSKENALVTNIITPQSDLHVNMPAGEKPKLFPIRKEEYSELPVTFGEKIINPVTKDQVVHYGIDIKANMGTDVIATAGGKVIRAGWEDKGYGNMIVIDHGDDYQSSYAHLKDINVKIGDSVTAGQVIGHIGTTGMSTGPHLHFAISFKGDRVNPLTILK